MKINNPLSLVAVLGSIFISSFCSATDLTASNIVQQKSDKQTTLQAQKRIIQGAGFMNLTCTYRSYPINPDNDVEHFYLAIVNSTKNNIPIGTKINWKVDGKSGVYKLNRAVAPNNSIEIPFDYARRGSSCTASYNSMYNAPDGVYSN
jgi:hypothetical protein